MPLKLGYPYEWQSLNVPGTFGKAEADPAHMQHLPM